MRRISRLPRESPATSCTAKTSQAFNPTWEVARQHSEHHPMPKISIGSHFSLIALMNTVTDHTGLIKEIKTSIFILFPTHPPGEAPRLR